MTTDKEIPITPIRLHVHKCLACGVEFNCPTSQFCTAQMHVLPMIYMQITEGKYEVVRHCGTTPAPSFPVTLVANVAVPKSVFIPLTINHHN